MSCQSHTVTTMLHITAESSAAVRPPIQRKDPLQSDQVLTLSLQAFHNLLLYADYATVNLLPSLISASIFSSSNLLIKSLSHLL
jgi:hypothetical protein